MPRSDMLRWRVPALAAAGAVVGAIAAMVFFAQLDSITRWALIPLAGGSLGAMVGIGHVVSLRARLLVEGDRSRALEDAERIAVERLAERHDLPGQSVAIGPNPWDIFTDEQRFAESASTAADAAPAEDVDVPASGSGAAPTLLVEPYDARRLRNPTDERLESARRAVAKLVADIAEVAGAFDAVCDGLESAGEAMARQFVALGRESLDHEKLLGADVLSRARTGQITEMGLDVLVWLRWVYEALHLAVGYADREFFAPVTGSLSAAYGASRDDWVAVISDPLLSIDVGGASQQIALRVKERRHELQPSRPDPRAVAEILDDPQWM